MNNIIIKNYKSIEHTEIVDCRKYNLFIGRPNVGKTNILEALNLFALPYFSTYGLKVNDVMRVDNASSLFFNGEVKNNIVVDSEINTVEIKYTNESNVSVSLKAKDVTQSIILSNLKSKRKIEGESCVKSYSFEQCSLGSEITTAMPYLCPVNGANLSLVINENKELHDDIAALVNTDGQKLVFDNSKQEYFIMRESSPSSAIILPLKSMADSLLRLIYYKTAIKSNHDSVILLEEPEAHTYPPYISAIVQEVIDSESNQFFISTHSPYVVNEFIDNNIDVAIYVVDMNDGKTYVKRLSDEQISQVYEYGFDLFFNTESLLS